MTDQAIKNNTIQSVWKRWQWLFWMIVILAVYYWAFTGIKYSGLQSSAGKVSQSILNGLVQPDWKYVYDGTGEDLVGLILQTLAIAFLGTFISALISVPISFWAARSEREKLRLRSGSGKIFLILIRTFPEIVLAIMFIKAVGPGSYAGVLAVSVHSVGMLGKLFSESIEDMDRGAEEAIYSAGGNGLQVFTLVTLPSIIPEFISYTLYRFEIAVRSAAILGLVGAGGIGAPLIFAIQTRNWSRVGIVLLGTVVMVFAIDILSEQLRKRLV